MSMYTMMHVYIYTMMHAYVYNMYANVMHIFSSDNSKPSAGRMTHARVRHISN